MQRSMKPRMALVCALVAAACAGFRTVAASDRCESGCVSTLQALEDAIADVSEGGEGTVYLCADTVTSPLEVDGDILLDVENSSITIDCCGYVDGADRCVLERPVGAIDDGLVIAADRVSLSLKNLILRGTLVGCSFDDWVFPDFLGDDCKPRGAPFISAAGPSGGVVQAPIVRMLNVLAEGFSSSEAGAVVSLRRVISNRRILDVRDSNFTGNISTEVGGAISVEVETRSGQETPNPRGSVFIRNTGFTINSGVPSMSPTGEYNPTAQDYGGGAVSIVAVGKVTIKDAYFESNSNGYKTSYVPGERGVLPDGQRLSVGSGGALRLRDVRDANIVSSTFTDNRVTFEGGHLAFEETLDDLGGVLTVTGGSFSYGISAIGGAAMSMRMHSSEAVISGVKMQFNEADAIGGAIYAVGGKKVSVIDSTIYSGGAGVENCSVTSDDGCLSVPESLGGGGFALESVREVLLRGTTIEGVQALVPANKYGGGGIAVNVRQDVQNVVTDLTIISCTFVRC